MQTPTTPPHNDVDEASKESFPASDPPSFMSGSTAAPAPSPTVTSPQASPAGTQGGDVDEASKESFPASDPPSFMSGSTAAPSAAGAQAGASGVATVTVYRVVGESQRERPFGADAASGGGRWTSDDVPAIYASQSATTALLEFLAHCDTPPESAWLASAEVPRERLELLEDTPEGWRERPYRPEVQHVGDDWVRSRRSLALQVPSALCDEACNVIINPAHVDAPLIQHVQTRPLQIDDRLRRIVGG
ncbi:RES family NAD+ phosphorylase [Lysobacter humi (ex Lee et al. 2017)]